MSKRDWANLLRENQQAFSEDAEESKTEEQVEEKPAESPTENDQNEESPSQKGEQKSKDKGKSKAKDESEDKPEAEDKDNTSDEEKPHFHKDPAWQRQLTKRREVEAQNKRYADMLEKLAPLADKFPQLEEKLSQLTKQPAISEEFRHLYGDTPEGFEAYKKMRDKEFSEFKKSFLEEFKREQEQAGKAEKEAMDTVASMIEAEVEDEFGVSLPRNSSDYNAFLKHVNDLVDAGRAPMRAKDGRYVPNFGACWEMYQSTKAPKQKSPALKKAAKLMAFDKSAPAETPDEDEVTMDNFATFKRRR